MKRAFAVVVILSVLPLAGCGSGSSSSGRSDQPAAESTDPGHVTRADFGAAWPFTVEEGTIRCEGSGGFGAVTFEAEGTTYAVNGTARGMGQWAEIDPIWKDNPALAGTKISIGPIIDRGLALCD